MSLLTLIGRSFVRLLLDGEGVGKPDSPNDVSALRDLSVKLEDLKRFCMPNTGIVLILCDVTMM